MHESFSIFIGNKVITFKKEDNDRKEEFYVKTIRVTGFMLCILFAFILLPFSSSGETRMPNDPLVYVIPVEQTVERGLFKFLERGFEEAIQEGADHIVLEAVTFI